MYRHIRFRRTKKIIFILSLMLGGICIATALDSSAWDSFEDNSVPPPGITIHKYVNQETGAEITCIRGED